MINLLLQLQQSAVSAMNGPSPVQKRSEVIVCPSCKGTGKEDHQPRYGSTDYYHNEPKPCRSCSGEKVLKVLYTCEVLKPEGTS